MTTETGVPYTRFPAVEGEVYVAWEAEDECFPAVVEKQRWNGWASPLFRREVAARIAEINDELVKTVPEASTFRWYGDVLLERWPQYLDEPLPDWPATVDDVPEEGFTVMVPFGGRYGVGAWAWTWWEVTCLNEACRSGPESPGPGYGGKAVAIRDGRPICLSCSMKEALGEPETDLD